MNNYVKLSYILILSIISTTNTVAKASDMGFPESREEFKAYYTQKITALTLQRGQDMDKYFDFPEGVETYKKFYWGYS
jgi:hypothetical protein